MPFRNLKPLGEMFKPTITFLVNVVMPLTATALFWSFLDRAVQVLAVLVLATMFLKNVGVDVDIVNKIKNSKVKQFLMFLFRSTTPVAKMDEEYFEETGKMLADGAIAVVEGTKKFKEEITNMGKFDNFRKEALLWINHNKKQVLAVIVFILFGLDYFFKFTQKYGLPQDAIYTIAAVVFLIVVWVMGGEGFTSNLINRVRENRKVAKKETNKTVKKYRGELARLNKQKDEILKFAVNGVLPPNKQTEYSDCLSNIDYYTKAVDELLENIEESSEDEDPL